MSRLLTKLEFALDQGLPGEQAHDELTPMKRGRTSDALVKAKNPRKSSVAIVLREVQSRLDCYLIQRPSYKGVHSAQVSFPGGKMEESDADLEHTARRETEEEIGLPQQAGKLITLLTEVYIPPSNFIVTPHLFSIDEYYPLKADEREVDEIITFNALQLLDDSIIKKTDIRTSNGIVLKNIPYFDIHDKVVWGATAIILSELKVIMKRVF